jgi:peptide/nickel transport system permease protein
VLTYLLRRLIASFALLVVVSMVVFAIFYIFPRLAGATPETMATRYVGRTATPETVRLMAERLGFYDPIYTQYWTWFKTIFTGGTIDMGTRPSSTAPPRAWATRTAARTAVLAGPDRPGIPVTFSLAFGAAILWLIGGVATGIISALRARLHLRPGRDVDGARRRLAADLFHRPACPCRSSPTPWLDRPRRVLHPVRRNPAQWAYALLLPWITLAFLFSPSTRGSPVRGCSRRWVRTTSAPRGPRASWNAP